MRRSDRARAALVAVVAVVLSVLVLGSVLLLARARSDDGGGVSPVAGEQSAPEPAAPEVLAVDSPERGDQAWPTLQPVEGESGDPGLIGGAQGAAPGLLAADRCLTGGTWTPETPSEEKQMFLDQRRGEVPGEVAQVWAAERVVDRIDAVISGLEWGLADSRYTPVDRCELHVERWRGARVDGDRVTLTFEGQFRLRGPESGFVIRERAEDGSFQLPIQLMTAELVDEGSGWRLANERITELSGFIG